MPLADFLAAKFELDQRSLNAAVRGALLERLDAMPQLRCLDVGAGTGASVRRLLDWRGHEPWRMTLVDRDEGLLAIARRESLHVLAARGHAPNDAEDAIRAARGSIVLRFAACELSAYVPDAPFDLVIAHAFLDLVPLAPALERFARWLAPGGCLYAAINCDGETALDPPYADAAFERELLVVYTESMERRRVDGEPTGGAFCGRRLEMLLPQHGFEIVRSGRSDWDIVPQRYAEGDETCLVHLLGLMAKEARNARLGSEERLARWHEDRLRQVRARTLGLYVRNTDVLARRMA